MPKHFHHVFEGGGIVVWRITETADELYAQLATDRYDEQLATKRHEARRAEWLAVRLLVKELFGTDWEVAYHPTGRPYLKSGGGMDSADSRNIHISISHTKGYAAVAYHQCYPIGLDIEQISDRVERIAHRFTSADETAYIDAYDTNARQMCHLINWSAKEALYKLQDSPLLADFRTSFSIAPYHLAERGILTASVHGDSGNHRINVDYLLFPDFVCVWGVGQSVSL